MLTSLIAAYGAVKSFFGSAWNKVVLYGTIAIAVVIAFFQARAMLKNAGRKEAEAEAKDRTISNIEVANEARGEIEQHQADDVHPDVRRFYRS